MSTLLRRTAAIAPLLLLLALAASLVKTSRLELGAWSAPANQQMAMPAALALQDLPAPGNPLVVVIDRRTYQRYAKSPNTYADLLMNIYGLDRRHAVASLSQRLRISPAAAEEKMDSTLLPSDGERIEIPLD